jgi:hypothetical protein
MTSGEAPSVGGGGNFLSWSSSFINVLYSDSMSLKAALRSATVAGLAGPRILFSESGRLMLRSGRGVLELLNAILPSEPSTTSDLFFGRAFAASTALATCCSIRWT